MELKAGRSALLPLCTVAVIGLAACSVPPAGTPAPPTTNAAPSDSASPAGVSDEQLTEWVDAAQLTPSVVGAPRPLYDQSYDQSGVRGMPPMCDQGLRSDADLVYSRHTTWVGSNIEYVEHAVFAFDAPGSGMVSAVRDRASICQTYEFRGQNDSAQLTNQGVYTLAKPEGTDDAYAVCELSVTLTPAEHVGEQAFICTAAFSRGQLAAMVRVFGDDPESIESAQRVLELAVSLAAPLLVDAVPVD